MAKQPKNLHGQTFGAWRVLHRDATDPRVNTNWVCQCRCGSIQVVRSSHISPTSKGCRRCASRKHGMAATALYAVWNSMLARCRNPKSQAYPYYGGRGITVCEHWLAFEHFFADMGMPPSSEHSLDRFPDQNGNYEPGNVRWATRVEQARNARKNLMIEAFGRIQCLAAWAEETGLDANTIRNRILRDGFAAEDALRKPLRRKRTPVSCVICGTIFLPKSTKRSKLCGKKECKAEMGRRGMVRRTQPS